MEYKVLCNLNLRGLRDDVEALLKESWKPQGGIFILQTDYGRRGYYQAMVRGV